MYVAHKAALEVIIITEWWTVLNFRNRFVYDTNKSRKNRMFDDIVSIAFSWVVHRMYKFQVKWNDWLQNPLLNLM